MVSLKKNISLIFINSLVFIYFMGLYTISNAQLCNLNQQVCCIGTTLSCCPKLGEDEKGNQLSYDLTNCKAVIDLPVVGIPSECEAGEVQYKPSGDCGTSTRTCCVKGDIGSWSAWDGECIESILCETDECWNGSKCVSEPFNIGCTCTNGTCSLTYNCVSGSGWKSSKSCTCDSGYEKNSSGECVHSTCAKGCSVGQYLREISSGVNKGQCECCYPIAQNANGDITTFANCVDTGIVAPIGRTCCRTAYDTTYYTLPSDFSTCEALGEAIQKPMYQTDCPSNGSLL